MVFEIPLFAGTLLKNVVLLRRPDGCFFYLLNKFLTHFLSPFFVVAGLFLTDSADSLKRAWFYCRKCHANIKSEKSVAKCGCKRTAVRMIEKDSRNGTRIQKKRHNNGADKVRQIFQNVTNNLKKLLGRQQAKKNTRATKILNFHRN
jgi:hypothetical protein